MAGIEADGIVDDGHGGDYARGHSHQLPADIAPRLSDVLRAPCFGIGRPGWRVLARRTTRRLTLPHAETQLPTYSVVREGRHVFPANSSE
jgi:hypothetical protein